jgi:putative membrane protein insertion efficiency factor
MSATVWPSFSVVSPKLLPRRVLMGLIWVYQSTIGPTLPPACRFQPTCSQYAFTAIERHGALRGTWLAARRLARCQPWGGSGYDPVP